MNNTMLAYIKKNTVIHKLTGAGKLIFFIFWTAASMITYDTRLLVALVIGGLVAFKISKIKFKSISFVIYFILFFLIINTILIFVFAPYQGVKIYGTRHNILHIIGGYYFTKEQLFYQFNIAIKYFVTLPMALLFIMTTDPSEFAASLNKIGVNYSIAYAVSLTLRYIPEIQGEYHDISFAQQARGIDMSSKEKFTRRIKNGISILMPLIFSSLDKIETVSCAMELRAFGNNKKRTWYKERKFKKSDLFIMAFGIILFAISLGLNLYRGSRYYNPFI